MPHAINIIEGSQKDKNIRRDPRVADKRRSKAGACSIQPEFYGAYGGLGAVGDIEFAEDASHVRLDGAYAEEEVAGDLGVGLALAEELQDLDLPGREAL